MNRSHALTILHRHHAEYAALGILSLSLIGSTARNEAHELSDIDLAVTLTDSKRGFARLERLDTLKDYFSGLFGCPVDIIEEPSASSRIQASIDQDRIRAF